MNQILAIAKITLKSAFRFKIVMLLAIFLTAAVIALPLLLKDDGTARGFVQILLSYSLGLTVTTLGFSTLWLSCGLLARDIEDCRIQVLVTKPVARWKIWLGKWLGIMTVNALLMALSAGVILGMLQYRSASLPEKLRTILKNEVFVARDSAKEPLPNLQEDIERIYKQKMEQSDYQGEVNEKALRRQITELVKHQYQLVPSGMMRIWTVPIGHDAKRLADQPLFMRVKFIAMSHTSTFEDERSFPMSFEVGPIDSPKDWRVVEMITPNTFHEIEIPPGLIDENGDLTIKFLNRQDDTFFFDLNDGMEVLYRRGAFVPNYLRGLIILLCWLGLLAAIGLAASSLLSFPVASFFAIFIMILGLSTSTMGQVIEEGGISGVDHETGKIEQRDFLDKFFVTTFKGLKASIELVKDFSPVELLSEGRMITWTILFKAIFQIVVLGGGIFSLIGIYCFSRRELALAKGGQS